MNSGIREGNLEILIAVLAGAMMDGSVGVIGSRHETAVGDKMFVGVEAFDAVDFKIDGKCREFADAGSRSDGIESRSFYVSNKNAASSSNSNSSLHTSAITRTAGT